MKNFSPLKAQTASILRSTHDDVNKAQVAKLVTGLKADLHVFTNPEMTKEGLDREVQQLVDLGIIDSGDAETKGIGAIDVNRVADFLHTMEKVGVIPEGSVDPAEAVTDQFVNKGVGLDLRPQQ